MAGNRIGHGRLERFSTVERAVHWLTAALTLVLMATGAVLWIPALSAVVNNRQIVKTVHLACGFLLPLPLLAGWVADPAVRRDTRRLGRFRPGEWGWFVGRWHRRPGKFNPGQKLNAAFVAGMMAVMLLSGLGMWIHDLLLDEWRTGLTLVHDAVFVATVVVVAGHIAIALRDPGALGGMWHGRVGRRWATRHHPEWDLDDAAVPDDEGVTTRTLAP